MATPGAVRCSSDMGCSSSHSLSSGGTPQDRQAATLGMFSLPAEALASLRQMLDEHVAKYHGKPLSVAWKRVQECVTASGLAQLREHFWEGGSTDVPDPGTKPLDAADIAFLAGYFDFLQAQGDTVAHNVPLRVRVEKRSGNLEPGYLAMVLTRPQHSLIRTVGGRNLSFTLSHKLYQERFVNNGSHEFVLGSYPGRSKFFSLAEVDPSLTKAEVIDLFGLKGYSKVKDPGPLHVVSVDPVGSGLQPFVVLAYKQQAPGEAWRPRSHFLEGSVPGFTQGGLSEVCCETVVVDADGLQQLGAYGVRSLEFE